MAGPRWCPCPPHRNPFHALLPWCGPTSSFRSHLQIALLGRLPDGHGGQQHYGCYVVRYVAFEVQPTWQYYLPMVWYFLRPNARKTPENDLSGKRCALLLGCGYVFLAQKQPPCFAGTYKHPLPLVYSWHGKAVLPRPPFSFQPPLGAGVPCTVPFTLGGGVYFLQREVQYNMTRKAYREKIREKIQC